MEFEEMKSLCIERLTETHRDGMPKLIQWMENNGFFDAPASTRFHSCHKHGLLEHSHNVYAALKAKQNSPVWSSFLKEREDAITITAYLHDLCKSNLYDIEMRNKKNEFGVWEQVPYYTTNPRIPYGHGECSVMIASEFIRFTADERYAIRWHMGWSEPKENYSMLGAAMKKCPLILALHEADQEATYLYEKQE